MEKRMCAVTARDCLQTCGKREGSKDLMPILHASGMATLVLVDTSQLGSNTGIHSGRTRPF